MARSIISSDDGRRLEIYREQIEVTSNLPRPDPDWQYTDDAGHQHDSRRNLLVYVQDDPDEPPFYIDVDGEEWNAPTHLECRLCGETIIPGSIGPSPFREFIPGPVHYLLDGKPISQQEAERIIAE